VAEETLPPALRRDPRVIADADGFAGTERALRRAKVQALAHIAELCEQTRIAVTVYAGADALIRTNGELLEFTVTFPTLAQTLEAFRQRIISQIEAFGPELLDLAPEPTPPPEPPGFRIVTDAAGRQVPVTVG